MLKGFLAAATLFTVLGGSALAQDLPRYDPKRFCRNVADMSGGSAMIEKGCLQIEQQSYNTLKTSWASLPARAKSFCDEVARTSGGTYQILEGCIRNELDAASSSQDFEF